MKVPWAIRRMPLVVAQSLFLCMEQWVLKIIISFLIYARKWSKITVRSFVFTDDEILCLSRTKRIEFHNFDDKSYDNCWSCFILCLNMFLFSFILCYPPIYIFLSLFTILPLLLFYFCKFLGIRSYRYNSRFDKSDSEPTHRYKPFHNLIIKFSDFA